MENWLSNFLSYNQHEEQNNLLIKFLIFVFSVNLFNINIIRKKKNNVLSGNIGTKLLILDLSSLTSDSKIVRITHNFPCFPRLYSHAGFFTSEAECEIG